MCPSDLDTEEGKIDYEGFLSPLAVRRYSEYMDRHRHQADGKIRSSDNWQKGMPLSSYMKSLWRHFMAAWTCHRGPWVRDNPNTAMEEALCGVIFNANGYLHELMKKRQERGELNPSWARAKEATESHKIEAVSPLPSYKWPKEDSSLTPTDSDEGC